MRNEKYLNTLQRMVTNFEREFQQSKLEVDRGALSASIHALDVYLAMHPETMPSYPVEPDGSGGQGFSWNGIF